MSLACRSRPSSRNLARCSGLSSRTAMQTGECGWSCRGRPRGRSRGPCWGLSRSIQPESQVLSLIVRRHRQVGSQSNSSTSLPCRLASTIGAANVAPARTQHPPWKMTSYCAPAPSSGGRSGGGRWAGQEPLLGRSSTSSLSGPRSSTSGAPSTLSRTDVYSAGAVRGSSGIVSHGCLSTVSAFTTIGPLMQTPSRTALSHCSRISPWP
mmetsp:Transcript_17648/g.51522  ORF Transcript_17648/g.51522 Transcript_17648/m.51522 type:complete len:209 (-) Transcript_17648:228-854(-)